MNKNGRYTFFVVSPLLILSLYQGSFNRGKFVVK
nr:MAG TPA: hypothetical protein [Caudoviricetes sp.]